MAAPDDDERSLWVRVGAREGAKLGALCAAAVVFPFLLSLAWATLSPEFATSEWTVFFLVLALLALGLFTAISLGVGMIFGVLPALLVGAATGALLCAALRSPHVAPYRWNRLAVGGGIALVMAFIVNGLLTPLALVLEVGTGIHWIYPYLPGISSLIFVVAALHFSERLPLRVEQERWREVPVIPRE